MPISISAIAEMLSLNINIVVTLNRLYSREDHRSNIRGPSMEDLLDGLDWLSGAPGVWIDLLPGLKWSSSSLHRQFDQVQASRVVWLFWAFG
jgi:hypothetical protein